ncbi:ornithine cyclodeaminase family protein [Acidaminobacter sp. JC074]|uniref:ornithine cyclodeaminase family protein n=1 Tax=Acidaminobacter sp. JC074 TaxID=2530199 RepID=UPI001F10C1FF|nr:ornithine cyclodeaminase family protein [Acidaminobacter sp. JC074]MCH4887202.1 ornithine cyclodeaminase family protein [Acidaminobacter sp. JC074]
MSKFYLIDDARVRASLDMLSVISKVEKAYILKAQNETKLFPVITHDWIMGKKDMDIKSGLIEGNVGVYGLKALTYMTSNDRLNIPRLTGTMMIFDSSNGQLKGLLDSRSITGMRTGAAGAVGAKYLARKDSKKVLIVGSGNQAFYNVAGLLMTMEHIEDIFIYDPLSEDSAIRFTETIKDRLKDHILYKYQEANSFEKLERQFNVNFHVASNLMEATKNADIIVTTTPSRKPLIAAEWVKEGTHITCVGSDMEGKQELDESIFSIAKVVVDDIKQAISIGETELAIKRNVIKVSDIYSEIGEVIINKKDGRTSQMDITIFDTTGLALQDLIVADHLIQVAKQDNLQTIEI